MPLNIQLGAVLLVAAVIAIRPVYTSLPPECSNYAVLSSATRSQNYMDKSSPRLCDAGLATRWYRFTGAAGFAMPTSCTREWACLTQASGWMNGAHPNVADGIVSRTVCFSWVSNCCSFTTNIRVRNCRGEYYVYELVGYGCHHRYCGNGADNIDECSTGTHRCAARGSTCTNTVGSFTCACNRGYTGDGHTCTDIDECSTGTHTCAASGSTCTNTAGSYTCACNQGYSGDGHTCTDIDECSTGTHTCAAKDSTCTNTAGSFTCACNRGYSGDGHTCTDIDECSTGTHTCAASGSTCTNTVGSFTCACNRAYTGDGHICTDIDECTTGTHACPVNGSTCTNTAGSYSCSCNPGYYGDGYNCTESTCSRGNPCRNGGTCNVINGGLSYSCNCRVGYTGNNCETGSGTNVTCGEDFMEIEMDREAFGDSQPQDFHLKSKSCRATLTGNKLSLRTPLDSCGTTHEQDDHFITYWNEVSTYFKQEDDRNGSAVIRTKNIHFPFFCKYGRKDTVTKSYSHAGTFFATEGAFGNFTFTMSLFRNASYLDSYGSREYPVRIGLNEPLYIEYGVTSTSADLAVFAENCRATTTGSPESLPRYDFIKAGCAVDDTMTYDYKLGLVQRFTIKSFRFISNHPVVYLHCELMVCHTNATNSRCKQGCLKSPVRVRRDTVDESMLYDLTLNGPMTQKTGGGKGEGKQLGGHDENKLSPVMVGVGATFGGLFLIVSIILLFILRRNRVARMRKGQPEVPVNMAAFEQKGVEDDEDQIM